MGRSSLGTECNPATICDVGCGAGDVLTNVAKHAPSARDCVGYDLYQPPQAWEKNTNPRVRFRLADFAVSDERYELVMLIDVVEHLEDPFSFVRQLVGRAKWFVFHIPLDLSILTLLRGGLTETRRQVGHMHWFTKPLAEAFLADAGLTVLSEQFTAASLFLKPRTVRARAARSPRRLAMRLNPELAALTLGGMSLMVLAVPDGG